jgi:hypothetical protein
MSVSLFYVGIHQPGQAQHFARTCISINRLKRRKKPVACDDVLVDSGAFTELSRHHRYRHSVAEYANDLRRLHDQGVVRIKAAVAQDYMCEPFILAKTGLTVEDHQRLTIERYDALIAERLPFPILPVLQGFAPQDYVRHALAYGDRLTPGMWVGVGSVCKRNGSPDKIIAVLEAIKTVRPDLRLHGFGIKYTSLAHPRISSMLYSADSMAWSFAARYEGRNQNCWTEAKAFEQRIIDLAAVPPPAQMHLPLF